MHERLLRRDPSLRGLLERAHFVIKLGLGEAQTGIELRGAIIARVAHIAGAALG